MMTKHFKSQRSYGFLITKELIFGFQILDLKDHLSASLRGPFFLGSFPQVLARVHMIKLFFDIVSSHGNADSHEYKLKLVIIG